MQELRLVGVHEDGEHLLLGSDAGETFRLRIDEALRSAAARPLNRPTTGGQPPALSPRDIQARIRAGASAEDVAAEAGLPLAQILRYEGPVRAERDYIAQQAQLVEVSTPLPGHDGYRSAFGDEPASLGEMVSYRLAAYGVNGSSVEWDSWRRPDGAWDVVARFELGPDSRVAIGEEPPARWVFVPARRTLQNSNRWAQLLSEIESMDGPLPSRRLSAVADSVFDFEESAADLVAEDVDAAAGGPQPGAPAGGTENSADELLEVLRSRRGQRLGADEEADDAFALMLSRGPVPAAHPRDPQRVYGGPDSGGPDTVEASSARPEADLQDTGGQPAEPAEPAVPAPSPRFGGLSLAPFRRGGTGPAAGLPEPHDAVSPETTEITVSASPRPAADERQAAPQDRGQIQPADRTKAAPAKEAAEASAEKKPVKPKRSSVPSWDDIVFGTKHD